jgi:hypothetical protein
VDFRVDQEAIGANRQVDAQMGETHLKIQVVTDGEVGTTGGG